MLIGIFSFLDKKRISSMSASSTPRSVSTASGQGKENEISQASTVSTQQRTESDSNALQEVLGSRLLSVSQGSSDFDFKLQALSPSDLLARDDISGQEQRGFALQPATGTSMVVGQVSVPDENTDKEKNSNRRSVSDISVRKVRNSISRSISDTSSEKEKRLNWKSVPDTSSEKERSLKRISIPDTSSETGGKLPQFSNPEDSSKEEHKSKVMKSTDYVTATSATGSHKYLDVDTRLPSDVVPQLKLSGSSKTFGTRSKIIKESKRSKKSHNVPSSTFSLNSRPENATEEQKVSTCLYY